MLIGIMSDSHDNIPNIKKAVNKFNELQIEHLYHAGDIVSPFTFNNFKNLNCPIDFVFGNNDGEELYLIEKFKGKAVFHKHLYEFTIDDKKFIMMHEPNNIEYLFQKQVYDVIIYGHTHKLDIRKNDKTLLINPGESCGILSGDSTILTLDTSTLEYSVIYL